MALDDLIPSLLGGAGALVGEFAVQGLTAFRRSVSDDLGTREGLPLVGLDLIEGSEEVLDGLALQLFLTDIGGVDRVEDLALSRLGDDLLIVIRLVRERAVHIDELVGGVDTVGDLLGRKDDGTALQARDTAELEIGLLHAGNILEVEVLLDSGARRRDDLVVVLHLFTLIDDRLHRLLAAFIDDDGRDLENSLGEEISLGIRDGNQRVDLAGHGLKGRRSALHDDILSQLGHLVDGRAGQGSKREGCCKDDVQ